jgi:hypothetical protein
MTEINATRRGVERLLSDTLESLIQRDERIAATVLRISGDRALTRAVEEDQRAEQAALFDLLIAVRELRGCHE